MANPPTNTGKHGADFLFIRILATWWQNKKILGWLIYLDLKVIILKRYQKVIKTYLIFLLLQELVYYQASKISIKKLQ